MELKGNWGNRGNDDFLYQIAFDFVAQIQDIMDAEGVGRAELAALVDLSKGRVSQVLNDPGNLTLKSVVQFTRALKRKVAIVAYDDRDPSNANGPIPPEVFVTTWTLAGRPTDMFSVNALAATTSDANTGSRWWWIPRLPRFDDNTVFHTGDDRGYQQLSRDEEMTYARTN
jgi:hypothetical protein